MDNEALSRELVRALRGRRSQRALNRRLGKKSNVSHAWESGARYPSASDFLGLLRLSGHEPRQVLARFGLTPSASRPGESLVAAWLTAMRRERSHVEIAHAIGCNRNTVRRWLEGTTEPRLPELLAFIEATTQRTVDFVELFLDPREVPSLAAVYEDTKEQRRLVYEEPWTHGVLRALELEEYRALLRHEPGFIASKVGIPREDEDRLLEALARAGQIRKQRGKWRLSRILAVDTRQDPIANARLKRHWAAVGLERLGAGALPPDSLYSYNLFAISEEGLERIRAAHLDYYERVRAIVAECTQPTRVVLANVQLVPLGQ